MKKFLVMLLVLGSIVLSGCSTAAVERADETEKNTSMFVQIEKSYSWIVVYHKDTKVMYVVSHSAYNCGNFEVLLNADGTPMLYEGE